MRAPRRPAKADFCAAFNASANEPPISPTPQTTTFKAGCTVI